MTAVAAMTKERVYQRWEDLLPNQVSGFDDAYAHLTADQLAALAQLARMVRLIETGKADAGGAMARDANKVREAFARDGLDADWLLSQRERVREARMLRSRNAHVGDGQVRLLGQVLPLSWNSDFGVTEFLLTASLGSCSHMPAPPYNEVAYVSSVEPIDVTAFSQEQGTPDPWVWVEGTVRYGGSTHIVNRVDGLMRIEAAHAIDPVQITPATAVELARLAAQARQEAEALLFPSLMDLVTRR